MPPVMGNPLHSRYRSVSTVSLIGEPYTAWLPAENACARPEPKLRADARVF